MHPEVQAFVRSAVASLDPAPSTVLDLGGRDINGSCRSLFPDTSYTVLDIRPGAEVDVVADAAEWRPDRGYELVLCTEVFEHTDAWRDICVTAYRACLPGGRFLVTCAGGDRQPHSAIRSVPDLEPGEHYRNLTVGELRGALDAAGFVDVEVNSVRDDLDLQATAVKPSA